ncbi:AraC family transcriptional regulator [bacterium LRH843]|nr:AraC family transcriptional regulator [bacterium LRH843]
MKAIQKKFASDNLFPFQIVYRESKSKQRELPFHFHEWYEMVYVYSGQGTFLIDQSIQSMEKGNVFIIPANTIHQSIPDKVNPVTSTVLFFCHSFVQTRLLGDSFDFLHLFEHCIRQKKYKYTLQPSQQEEVERYLQEMDNEIQQVHLGYRHASQIHLQTMLLYLSRELTSYDVQVIHDYTGPGWMNDVLSYIEDHFMEGVSLEALSTHGNVSTAHLSRVFKKMTGMNISEYIATKKVLKAKELLLQTEKKVTEIASICGFESMPYFHRTFKKYSGVTPSAYRKKN